MKKSSFSLLMVAIVAMVAAFSSCSNTTEKTQLEEQRFRVVEPEFFWVVTETVKAGDTVWDRAKVYYGNGLKWTDIVAENPFLQQPGRIWQDKVSGKWYVLIFPGEKLVMDQKEVNLTFIDTIDTPAQQQKEEGLPWWAWLLIILGAIMIIAIIINWIRCCNRCCDRDVVYVNVPRGGDINQATIAGLTAYQERSYQFWGSTIRHMLDRNDLSSASFTESSNPDAQRTLNLNFREVK
jgi:hypothetical protein